MITRVGFTLIGGKNWTGGYNYLLNLLQVLATEQALALVPVLFVGTDISDTELAPFAAIAGCELIRDPAFDDSARSASLVRSLVLGRDAAVHAALERERVDVAFESALFLGWRLKCAAIAWIPDLQHRFLAQHFTRAAWWRREIGFRAQIASGRTVMCSSEDTRQACERIYPGTRGRVHAVRFALRAPESLPDEMARAVAVRHGLPERFFFMPNQFWEHKNHNLVVQALKLLRERGQAPTVVACGAQRDPRNPGHVSALLSEVRAAGLEEYFLAPGLLPYADLMPLMQASTALLNPSLFEGWSTTVEEARAAGVPMLLSDLPVHREQAGELATYFDRNSAASLADAMTAFKPLTPAQRMARRAQARGEAAVRVAGFAADFVQLVQRAAAGRQRQ